VTFDMARYGDSRYRPPAITESDLFAAALRYGEIARPCLCGTVVIADERDPGPGVRRHQAEPRHAAWAGTVYG
jgi:hypothetical protein